MALTLDTMLPTPYGWTLVADLTPSTILIDELGYPCRIKELSEPYVTQTYDLAAGWGNKTVPEQPIIGVSEEQVITSITYRRFMGMWETMLFNKTTTVPKDALDLMPENWPVWTRADIPRASKAGRKAKPKAQDFTTVEVSKSLKYSLPRKGEGYGVLNHHIPTTFPLQLAKRDFRIPPYVLGVMIMNYVGDAKIKVTNKTFHYYESQFAKHGVQLTHPTDEFIKQRPYKLVHCDTGLEPYLDDIGFKKYHIPAEYLRGSSQERMELLQGLLDQHTPRFYKTPGRRATALLCETELFATQVAELVRTLGYPAFIKKGPTAYWYVQWYPADNPYIMPRLRTRYGIVAERVGNGLERFVWKIYYCDKAEKRPVRDISVHSPHGLYAVSELFLPMKSDQWQT